MKIVIKKSTLLVELNFRENKVDFIYNWYKNIMTFNLKFLRGKSNILYIRTVIKYLLKVFNKFSKNVLKY